MICAYQTRFYPRDAMLARVQAMGLCLSVSVTSQTYVDTAERIELGFSTGASFHQSYTVLKGYLDIFKLKGTYH